jgi:hypothetical protein
VDFAIGIDDALPGIQVHPRRTKVVVVPFDQSGLVFKACRPSERAYFSRA